MQRREGMRGGKIVRGCIGLPCTAWRVIELSSRALLVVQGLQRERPFSETLMRFFSSAQ